VAFIYVRGRDHHHRKESDGLCLHCSILSPRPHKDRKVLRDMLMIEARVKE